MNENEHNEEGEDGEEHMCGGMKKDFKLAMLDKKEKILKIKLEFIGKMKEMINKMPDSKK